MSAAEKLIQATLVAIDRIRLDGGTQSRAELSSETVAEYAERVDYLPPVDVFHDGQDYWLADGFHRCRAFVQAGRDTVPCIVHQGTQRDAILFSVGANDTHGLRRSNADKRRAVTLLVNDEEWKGWSDKIIAGKCGVSREFVCRVRGEQPVIRSQVRTGEDGKTRRVPEPRTPKADSEICDLHGCGMNDTGECPVCASRLARGLPRSVETSVPPTVDEAQDDAEDDWQDEIEAPAEAPAPCVVPASVVLRSVSIAALEGLAEQRAADPDFAGHHEMLRLMAGGSEASRAQRMALFVLDGGEVALLLLGLDWSVTADTLRAAHRAASFATHPDRGGTQDAFMRVNRARDLVARMLGEG